MSTQLPLSKNIKKIKKIPQSLKINDKLKESARLMEKVSALIVLTVTAVLIIRIISRPLGFSIPGISAISRLMGIWLSFLIIPQLVIENKHVTVDFFYNRLSSQIKRRIDTATFVLSAAFSFLLAVSGAVAVSDFSRVTHQEIGISMGWFYLSVPTTMVITSLCCLIMWKEI